MLVAVKRSKPLEAALLGLVAGTVANLGAFHWCLDLMHRYSKLGLLAYLMMLLMCAYQALSMAVWCALLRSRVFTERPAPQTWLLSCASYAALEFFHPIIFPWYLANTQHSRPEVLGLIELTGVSGLSFLLVAVNLGLAGLAGKQWRGLLVALGLLGLNLGFTSVRTDQIEEAMEVAPKLRVGLVQPNDWVGESVGMFRLHRYQRMTQELIESSEEPLGLILWPESAVLTPPPPMRRGDDREEDPATTLLDFPLDMVSLKASPHPPAASFEEEELDRSELLALQRGHQVPLLFGTTVLDTNPEAEGAIPGREPTYNCGVLIDQEGTVLGIAKKVKLLIFGETIPFSDLFPQVYSMVPMASALLAGEEPVVMELGQARLGIMICYEDLLPWFHYDLAQRNPQILLNLTNDAWFGRTGEAEAHLALAKLRSLEGRCYLIRSTTTGVSAYVDPMGREVARVGLDEAGVLNEEVALMDTVTVFERFGDWLAWGCLLLCLAAFIRPRGSRFSFGVPRASNRKSDAQ